MSERRVCLGRLGAPYGIKGWVKLVSFTQPRENLLAYQTFYATPAGLEHQVTDTNASQSQTLVIDESRVYGKGLIGHIKGFDTPEAVKTLTGLELYVDADVLPALEQGDYYWHQLTGLQVSNTAGQVLGRVSRLLETGANDVLVVEPTENSLDDRERLIPWLPEQVVLQVDLATASMLVEWEADYLL